MLLSILNKLTHSLLLFGVTIYNRYSYLLVKGIILFSLIPFLLLCFYAQPYLDDFIDAKHIMNLGIINFIIYEYKNMTGRFSDMAFYAVFNPLAYYWISGIKVYYFFTIILFTGTLFFALKQIFNKILLLSQLFWISLGGASFYITTMPEPFSSLYWFCSSIGYFLTISYIFVFLGLFYRLHTAESRKEKILLTILSSLMAVLITGSHEILFLSAFMLFFLTGFYHFIKKTKNRYFYLFLLVVVMVSGIVVVTAPGNFQRMDVVVKLNEINVRYGEGSYFILKVLFSAIYNTLLFFSAVFTKVPFVILSFLFIPLGWKLLNQDRIRKIFNFPPIFAIIYLIALVFCNNLAVIYATGALNLAGRVQNLIYFLFLVSWIVAILSILNYLKNIQKTDIEDVPVYIYQLCLIIMLFYIFSGPVKQGYADIFNDARIFNREMNMRYDLIKDLCKSKKQFEVIPSVSVRPKSFCEKGDDFLTGFRKDSIIIRETLFYFNVDKTNIEILNKFEHRMNF